MLDTKAAGCKGKLTCMVSLIFVSGMAVGALTMHLAERHWVNTERAALSAAEKEMAVQHFSRELDLNAEQAKAIEDVLDEFIMQQANLMAEFDHTRASGHDRILRILNEDQQKRLKKVVSELSKKRRD
ncbi:MAG: hypothetical protein HY238_27770 [Acidobacteria bacterium]|nr:hypothetical protein [Acidobacteriota bacterium]